jgi:hypothetical protein
MVVRATKAWQGNPDLARARQLFVIAAGPPVAVHAGASLVHDRLVAMIARGWADLDSAALGLLAVQHS